MADATSNLKVIINAEDNASKVMSKMGDQLKGAMDKVSKASAVGLAALTGFVAFSAKGLADSAEHFENLSKSTGISIETLSVFEAQTKAMGMPLESVTGAMKKLQIAVTAMDGDAKKAAEALKPLGIQFKDIKDLTPEEQLFKIGNAIASIQDPALRTAEAVKFFGKSGTDLLPFFQDGTASMADMTAKARELGIVMDDKTAKAGLALDAALDKLQGSLAGAATQMAVALAPALTKLVEQITPFIIQLADWIAKNPELTAEIIKWTAATLAVGAAISPLINIVTSLGAVLTFLTANPVAILVGALVVLGTQLVILYNQNEDFRNFVDATWQAIQQKIQDAAVFIYNTWIEYSPLITAVWQKIWTDAQMIYNTIIVPVFNGIMAAIEWLWQTYIIYEPMISAIWNQLWTAAKLIYDTVIVVMFNAITGIVVELHSTFIKYSDFIKKAWQLLWTACDTFYHQVAVPLFDAVIKAITGIYESVKPWLEKLQQIWQSVWSAIKNAVQEAWNTISGILNQIVGGISNAISSLERLISKASEAGRASSSAVSKAASIGTKILTGNPFRAEGGSVSANTPYVVGEKGMELFVPNTSGTIIPNNKLASTSGSSVQIIITGNSFVGEEGIAERIGDQIMKALRQNVKLEYA